MDTITIELRSRLRSCNIFISTKKTVTKNTINLKLNESEITLKIGKHIFNLPLNLVKIIPKTLSSLTVTDNWISLRVQTEPIRSAWGSFKREVVGAEDTSLESKKKLDVTVDAYELRLKEKKLLLLCSRCKNEISDTIYFKRVLPLPSDNSDPGEWFCCTHAAGENYKSLTEPAESDCFYEKDYKILNKILFKKELKIGDDEENDKEEEKEEEDKKEKKKKTTATIRCNRCLSGIGARYLEYGNDSVKVWNCCVDYKFIDDSSYADITASDPLRDFASIIVDRTDIFTGNKLLVQSSDGVRSHYLLVRVMDQNLELLIEKEMPYSEYADYTVELISNRVTKVLYKYSETEAEIKNYSVDVDRCQVALPVMLAAIEHLSSTTKRYPPSCRVIDKYFVGYILC